MLESHNYQKSLNNELLSRWRENYNRNSVIKSNADFFNSGTCRGCGWQPMANVKSTSWAEGFRSVTR